MGPFLSDRCRAHGQQANQVDVLRLVCQNASHPASPALLRRETLPWHLSRLWSLWHLSAIVKQEVGEVSGHDGQTSRGHQDSYGRHDQHGFRDNRNHLHLCHDHHESHRGMKRMPENQMAQVGQGMLIQLMVARPLSLVVHEEEYQARVEGDSLWGHESSWEESARVAMGCARGDRIRDL